MVEIKFEENHVVCNLCKSSKRFNLFYQKERLKYRIPISWILKTDLEEGLNARAVVETSDEKIETYKIHFRKFPDKDEAFLIAHEIEHVIRFIENKSLRLGSKYKESAYLTTAFMTMLEDPIVDSFLNKKYKFDLLIEYKKGLKQAKKDLDRLDKEPSGKYGRLVLMLNLSKQILCWNLIKDQNTHEDWIKYKKDYKEKCPNVCKMSKDMLSIIQKTSQGKGLEEREKHALIFKRFDKHFEVNKNSF
jgi:hypothetical protein